MYACMYVIYACVYTYTYHTYMYGFMHACLCVHLHQRININVVIFMIHNLCNMYVCMLICIYVRMYIYF